MLVSRRNGKSVAYPAGTITDFACGQIVPKYLKFAYSAHFGFNVMRSNVSIDEAACDSMLTFVVDGAVLVRRHLKSYNVENDRVVIEWSPFKGIDVKTVITPTLFGHTRSHEIRNMIVLRMTQVLQLHQEIRTTLKQRIRLLHKRGMIFNSVKSLRKQAVRAV